MCEPSGASKKKIKRDKKTKRSKKDLLLFELGAVPRESECAPHIYREREIERERDTVYKAICIHIYIYREREREREQGVSR